MIICGGDGTLNRFVNDTKDISINNPIFYYASGTGKVWLAPSMNGRYYGGGMMPAPNQRRDNPEHKVSLMVFHGAGKLKTLMIFPSIFKGRHIKHTKYVSVMEGKEIKVEFNRPTPLQIDGDTVLGATSYTVSAW